MEAGETDPVRVRTASMMTRPGSVPFPSLVRGAAQRRGGSKMRSHGIDIREALLLNRCAARASERSALRADFEQTAPALATRGHPRLTLGGDWRRYLGHFWSVTARISQQ
jgi:hypothetical protein